MVNMSDGEWIMDVKEGKTRLLIVDDDPFIRTFVRSVFEDRQFEIDEAPDGSRAIEMVKADETGYELAFMDINMPGMSGLQALPILLKHSQDLAVIIMSGFAEVDTAVEAMKAGAYDLLQKPINVDELETRVQKALEQRALRIEHRRYIFDIERRVAERTSELEATRKATIIALARLAETRDKETGDHIHRMAYYTVAVARSLHDRKLHRNILDEQYFSLLFESAPLHDIGKVGIPDSILSKPGKLTAEEFEVMKRHTVIGAEAIRNIFVETGVQSFLNLGAEIALSHHERYDGTGYPQGLKGEDIPLSARILGLTDFYDAVSSPRVYRPYPMPHEEVKQLIQSQVGLHFDPDVVEAFFAIEPEILQIRQNFSH